MTPLLWLHNLQHSQLFLLNTGWLHPTAATILGGCPMVHLSPIPWTLPCSRAHFHQWTLRLFGETPPLPLHVKLQRLTKIPSIPGSPLLQGCTFSLGLCWPPTAARISMTTFNCEDSMPPIQLMKGVSFTLKSLAASLRVALAALDHSFCVLPLRKYFPEDPSSMTLVSR